MGRAVNFTEVVVNSNIPAERKVQRMQAKMMESMRDLDKRFREAIERYDLNEPEEELFTGYNPTQFYDVVLPVLTLFDRARFITEVHKGILRWMATEYGLSTMSESTQKTQVMLFQVLTDMRSIYSNNYGYKMFTALQRELARHDPGEITDGDKDDAPSLPHSSLNGLLQLYFGVTTTTADRKEDPALNMLTDMLMTLGEITGHKKAAKELAQAVKHIDD